MGTHRLHTFLPFLVRRPKKTENIGSQVQNPPIEEPQKPVEKFVEIQQPSMTKHPSASLLGIPQDIRNNIYEHCVPDADVKLSLSKPFLPELGANLRLTCRQLYHEIQGLSWTRGTLLVHSFARKEVLSTSHLCRPAASLIKRVGIQSSLLDLFIVHSKFENSDLAKSLKPKDLILQLCTCSIKDLDCFKYLRLMSTLRDNVTYLLRTWPNLNTVTFFYCDDSDPATTANFPNLSGMLTSLWTFPSTFRSAFEPDARYFGPWYPDKTVKNGVVEFHLNSYDGRGKMQQTAKLEFFNVMDVYRVPCVLRVMGKLEVNKADALC